MKARTKIVLLAALAGLTGCASNIVHEGKYAQDDGWQKGEVVDIGPANSLTRPAYYDCRIQSTGGKDDAPYVVVAFLRNGQPYARIAKLPADAQLKVGDRVYVNIKDCTAPLPKRS